MNMNRKIYEKAPTRDVLEFPRWDAIKPEIVYIAKEPYGDWWGYESKPRKVMGHGWNVQEGKVYDLECLAGLPECDWENSLIKRPQEG